MAPLGQRWTYDSLTPNTRLGFHALHYLGEHASVVVVPCLPVLRPSERIYHIPAHLIRKAIPAPVLIVNYKSTMSQYPRLSPWVFLQVSTNAKSEENLDKVGPVCFQVIQSACVFCVLRRVGLVCYLCLARIQFVQIAKQAR
jgi:hypothetical protein